MSLAHSPSARSGLFLVAGLALTLILACGGGSGGSRGTQGSSDPSALDGWTGAVCLESNLIMNSYNPSVAVDGVGNAMVAWERGSEGIYEIYAKAFRVGSGWGPEGTLFTQDGTVMDPKVAVAGDNAFLLSWDRSRTSTDSDIYVSQWTPGQYLDTPFHVNGGFGISPSLAVNGAGDACLVWMEVDGTYSTVQASRYLAGSGTWTAPEPVSTTLVSNALWPSVAMDGAGDVTVLWVEAVDYSAGPFSIHMATFLKGQGWSEPFSPQKGTGASDTLTSLAMSDAGAQATWSESLDDGATFQVYTCRWSPSDDTVSAPVRLSSAGITGYGASVGIDAHGRAQAAWVENGGSEVYSASSSATGVWQASKAIASGTPGVGNVKLSVNASGQGAVLWQESDGSLWTIRAALNLSGSSWSEPRLLQSKVGGSSYSPDIAIGNGGLILAVWHQVDTKGIRHIYANRHP